MNRLNFQSWSTLLDFYKELNDKSSLLNNESISKRLKSLSATSRLEIFGIGESNWSLRDSNEIATSIEKYTLKIFCQLNQAQQELINSKWDSYFLKQTIKIGNIKENYYINFIECFIKFGETYDEIPSFTEKNSIVPNIIDIAHPVSEKLLAHIMANEFGKGSELEGYSSLHTLNFLYQFLKDRSLKSRPYGVSHDLIHELLSGINFHHLRKSDGISSLLLNYLQNKVPLLIPGGWIGNPTGHAIFYEIIPGSNEKASFRLYNLGGGTEIFGTATVGLKEKSCPVVEWKGVSYNNFLHPQFKIILNELADHKTFPTSQYSQTSTSYSGHDIYKSLKEILLPETEELIYVNNNESILMTPQRAEMCSWKSLLAFLRTKMDEKNYKIFKCDVKLQALIDSYKGTSKTSDNPLSPKGKWSLIQKSLASLSRSIIKLYENNFVGYAYIQKAHKLLIQVHEWVKENEPEFLTNDKIPKVQNLRYQSLHKSNKVLEWEAGALIKPEPPLNARIFVETKGGLQRKSSLIADIKRILSKSCEVIECIESSWFNETSSDDELFLEEISNQLEDFFDLEEVKEDRPIPPLDAKVLDKIFNIVLPMVNQAWLNKYDYDSHTAMNMLIAMFPIDELFWNMLVDHDPEKAKHLILLLGEMQNLYFKTCLTIPHAEIMFPERILGLNKILYIQNHLAEMIAPKIWPDIKYVSAMPGMPHYDVEEFHLSNPKDENEWIEIHHWLSKKAYIPLFTIDISEDNKIINEFYLYRENKISDKFLQLDPDLNNKVVQENPDFNDFPKYKQNALIYASPYLAPWIRAVMDSYLYSLFDIKEFSYNPNSMDRNKEIHWETTLKEHHQSLKINFTLNGLSAIGGKRAIGFYPSFKSRKFYYFVGSSLSNEECSLVTERMVPGRFKNREGIEEFKEFAYVALNLDLCIPSIFSFFTIYPNRLYSTDYQMLFEKMVFRIGCVQKALKLSCFEDKIVDFIEVNVQKCLDDHQIQAAVFLARMSRYFSRYTPDIRLRKQQLPLLRDLLKIKNLDVRQKGAIYCEICAYLSKKNFLDESDIEDLLVGSVFIGRNPPPQNWTNEYLKKDISDSLQNHAAQLKKALILDDKPNQNLLNSILKGVRPEALDQRWLIVKTVNEEFPHFSNWTGSYEYFPLLGDLTYPGVNIMLPNKITQEEIFKELFPTIQHGDQLQGNIFSFKDTDGTNTHVRLKNDELVIDQFRGSPRKWHRYMSKNDFIVDMEDEAPSSPLYSRHLIKNYYAWRDLSANPLEILLVDPTTKEEKYHCRFGVEENETIKIKKVRRISDNALLGVSSRLMQDFEDPEFIHEWYLNGSLVELELPRYSLSFKTDFKPSTLYCDQFPGFFLKPGELLQQLGIYTHYLILENDQGSKKALLPVHHFTEPDDDTKLEVFEPRYTINKKVRECFSKPQFFHAFDVIGKGTLFSESREANLYLAEVSLLIQNYQQAAALLKQHGTKLRAYTSQETKILSKIAQIDSVTGNIEGNAIGIQMYASYLLEKNLRDFPGKDRKNVDVNLSENYQFYLNHFNTIQVLKLSKEEELYVIRAIDQSPVISNRIRQLKRAANKIEKKKAYSLSSPFPAFEQRDPKNLDFTDLNLDLWRGVGNNELVNEFKHNRITRLYYKLQIAKFPELYALIWCLPAETISFIYRPALIFWKNSISDSSQGKMEAILLILVIDHQDSFPQLPSDPSNENLKNWWNQVILTAHQIYNKNSYLEPVTHNLSIPSIQTGGIFNQPSAGVAAETFKLQEIPPLMPKRKIGNSMSAWFAIKEQLISSKQASTEEMEVEEKKIHNILNDLIEQSLGEGKQPDPLVKKEVDRIKGDFTAYDQRPPAPIYILNDSGLFDIEHFCESIITSNDENSYNAQIDALKLEIINLARRSPLTKFGVARKELLEWGGSHKPLKIDELIINFAKQDPTALKKRNPSLSTADIQQIYEKIAVYLQLCTRKQQAQRALATVKRLIDLKKGTSESSDAAEELVQQLAGELIATPKYTLAENPAFLVFEYFADIMLREPQVAMIFDFLNNKDLNAIRELIMGSGKSKVLMPLLALLRADGKCLSTMIVPQALYQSVTSDTQAILKDAFSVALHTFEFDRNMSFDVSTLDNILEELKSIRDNKEALILTSKSLQCLLLKFIEKTCAHFSSPFNPGEMTPELKLMREILVLLSEKSQALLDEADLLLNVLHEISFSMGKVNGPILQEIDIITELYEILYNNKKIKKLARIESDPNSDPNAPILTDKLYHDAVQIPLAEAFIERMKTKEFDNKGLQKTVNNCFCSIHTEEQMQMVLDYLCRTKGKEEFAQSFYDAQNKEIQEILAIAGEEISNLLPHSLLKSCDEKYGIDEDEQGLLAIPFSAANTPSRGSEFASHHVTMNYTLQTYVKKKISRDLLVSQIYLLQENARREILVSLDEITCKSTAAWKFFCQIKGNLEMPLFNLNDKQIDLILEEVNQNATVRLRLVQNFILPQITIYDSKISSNSHNFASLLVSLIGFTGSLWNSDSMHRKLTPKRTEGTDAHTISILWNKSFDAIHTIPAVTAQEMMDYLKKTGVCFDMLADAGGYFKENDNLKNAKLLCTALKKPVVFYDSQGDQTVWDGILVLPLAESPFKEKREQRATFLDQAHTTGADITQHPTAIGFVTIGANMILRDLLQAVWRLRGLEKSQKVEFIVSHDVEQVIRQTLENVNKGTDKKITFADILLFVIINQAKQQGKDNFKAFNAELNEVSQKAFLQVMMNPYATPQQCADVVQKLGSTWIKPAYASAAALYGQIPLERKSDVAWKLIKEKAIAKARDLDLIDKIADIEEISERFKDRLPLTVLMKSGDEDLLEQEQQKIAEKQAELETFTSDKREDVYLVEINEEEDLKTFTPTHFSPDLYSEAIRANSGYNSKKTYPLPIFPLQLFFKEYEDLKPYMDVFKGIEISLGMLQIKDKNDLTLADIALFGQYRKEIKYVMIENDKIILINNNEANRRIKKEYTNIYETTIGYLNSQETISDECAQKLIKIKFLSGESFYTRKELDFLRTWIENEGVQKMYDLFNNHILEGQISKSRKYKESTLQSIFHQLMEPKDS